MGKEDCSKRRLSSRRRAAAGEGLATSDIAEPEAGHQDGPGQKGAGDSTLKATAGEIRERLLQASASAFQTLLELLENAETDTVRLRAAQDILDRAGFKPVDKREVSGVSSVVNTSVDYSDPAAVAARIAELKKRLEEAKNDCGLAEDGAKRVN